MILLAVAIRFFGFRLGGTDSTGELQVLACYAFAMTSPVSFGMALWTLIKKEWKKVAMYSIAAFLPWLTFATVLTMASDSTSR